MRWLKEPLLHFLLIGAGLFWLFFNVGVEVGQLMFVGTLIAAHALRLRLAERPPAWATGLAAYAIGGFAAYWTIDRAVTFWG